MEKEKIAEMVRYFQAQHPIPNILNFLVAINETNLSVIAVNGISQEEFDKLLKKYAIIVVDEKEATLHSPLHVDYFLTKVNNPIIREFAKIVGFSKSKYIGREEVLEASKQFSDECNIAKITKYIMKSCKCCMKPSFEQEFINNLVPCSVPLNQVEETINKIIQICDELLIM